MELILRLILLTRTILSVFWRSVTKITVAAETKEPSLGSTKMSRFLRLRLSSLGVDSPVSLFLRFVNFGLDDYNNRIPHIALQAPVDELLAGFVDAAPLPWSVPAHPRYTRHSNRWSVGLLSI